MRDLNMNTVKYYVEVNVEKALQYIDTLVAKGVDVDYKTAKDKAMSLIECSIKASGDYTGPQI